VCSFWPLQAFISPNHPQIGQFGLFFAITNPHHLELAKPSVQVAGSLACFGQFGLSFPTNLLDLYLFTFLNKIDKQLISFV